MEPTQGSNREQPSPTPHSETRRDLEVRVRRSPKYGVFMAIGALVGAVASWLLSISMSPGVSETGQRVDTTPVIGLVVVGGFVFGAALGAAVALVFDRVLSRRTHTATAERIDVTETDASADAAPPASVVEAEFEHVGPTQPQSGTEAAAHDAGALDAHAAPTGEASPHGRAPQPGAADGHPSHEERDRSHGA